MNSDEIHILVDNIIQKIELLLRGGKTSQAIDVTELTNESIVLLNKLHNNQDDDAPARHNLSTQSTDLLKKAVKLHNKARNLNSNSQGELKGILKACSGWILYYCGGGKAKVLSSIIKIFSKAGQELSSYSKVRNHAIECFSVAIKVWKTASELSIQRDLPPIEVQDVRTATFWAYCERASFNHNLLCMSESGSDEQVHKDMLSALEISLLLPAQLRFTFANRAMSLGESTVQQHNNRCLKHALSYFKMALNMIDSILFTTDKNDTNEREDQVAQLLRESQEVSDLRCKAFLCLAYVYMETNEFDRALTCISNLENTKNNKTIKLYEYLCVYARFQILLRDGDIPASQSTLRQLLNIERTPYTTALTAVKLFVDNYKELLIDDNHSNSGNSSDNNNNNNNNNNSQYNIQISVITEFYALLMNKFNRDPYYSNIRISYLQAILSKYMCEGTIGSSIISDVTKEAISITSTIINDHTTKEHVLEIDNYNIMRGIISDRVRWHLSMGQWEVEIEWLELLHKILSSSENNTEEDVSDCKISIALMKCEALINISNNNNTNSHNDKIKEALVIAKHCADTVPSTRSTAMLFKTMLYCYNYTEEAIINDIMIRSNLSQQNKNSSCSIASEVLIRFIICIEIAINENNLIITRKNRILYLLQRQWMIIYKQYEIFNIIKINKSDQLKFSNTNYSSNKIDMISDAEYPDYLEVARSLMCSYLETILKSTLNISKSRTPVVASSPLSNDRNLVLDIETNDDIGNSIMKEVISDAKESNNIIKVDDLISDGKEEDTHSNTDEHKSGGSDRCLDSKRDSAPALGSKLDLSTDFFSIKGYPDCMVGDAAFTNEYSIACTVKQLRGDMLLIFEEILAVADSIKKSDDIPFTTIGKREDLLWLINLIWNMAVLLNDPQHCSLISESFELQEKSSNTAQGSIDQSEKNGCEEFNLVQRLLLSAELFEMCQLLLPFLSLFSLNSSDATNNNEMNDASQLHMQCHALLIATATRIEVFECINVEKDGILNSLIISSAPNHNSFLRSPEVETPHRVTTNQTAFSALTESNDSLTQLQRTEGLQRERNNVLLQALIDVQKAETLILPSTSDDKYDFRRMSQTALYLQFIVLCRMGDNQRCAILLSSREGDFVTLPVHDLHSCVDFARFGDTINTEVINTVLTLAVQACSREGCRAPVPSEGRPYTQLLCLFYRLLIEQCSTRMSALEKLEEFEQLIRTYSTTTKKSDETIETEPKSPHCDDTSVTPKTDDNENIFDIDEIDRIVAIAFNYGLTLIDLDQVNLAERFVSRAISLLPHTSKTIQSWLPHMQDTYTHVLKAKENAKKRHRQGYDDAVVPITIDTSTEVVNSSSTGDQTFNKKARQQDNDINKVTSIRDQHLTLDEVL